MLTENFKHFFFFFFNINNSVFLIIQDKSICIHACIKLSYDVNDTNVKHLVITWREIWSDSLTYLRIYHKFLTSTTFVLCDRLLNIDRYLIKIYIWRMILIFLVFWNFLSCFVRFWTSFTYELYIVQKYSFRENFGRHANQSFNKEKSCNTIYK